MVVIGYAGGGTRSLISNKKDLQRRRIARPQDARMGTPI